MSPEDTVQTIRIGLGDIVTLMVELLDASQDNSNRESTGDELARLKMATAILRLARRCEL
jgi:hypothetical protein